MKLGIVSDTHDRVDVLRRALDRLRELGAERLIHCGDITEPATVQAFTGWTVDFVYGNCDYNRLALQYAMEAVGGTLHEPFGRIELVGKQIAWVHSDDARLFYDLEQCGEYDYLFYGHTHVREEHLTGRTRVVNVGALHRAAVKTCGLLHVENGIIETVTVV